MINSASISKDGATYGLAAILRDGASRLLRMRRRYIHKLSA
jgi:hypothetical protein